MGGCQLEWEVEQAYIPEKQHEAENRQRWENIQKMSPEERFTL